MPADLPFAAYDQFTVKDTKEAIRHSDGVDEAEVLAYERDHKDRVTLTRWLENRLEGNAESDDDGPEMVAVASTRSGMIAGILFEDAHETRVLERSARVEEAISDGYLRELEREP